jgi:antitoxin component YwqK of YwqJK toxin-antitoxin module
LYKRSSDGLRQRRRIDFLTKKGDKLCSYYVLPNGNKEGLYEQWYDNGKICVRCSYVNGKLDGLYESCHDNGKIWKRCNYVNGKKEGLYEKMAL